MAQSYFWSMVMVMVAVVTVITLISFAWRSYRSFKGCEERINSTASIAKSIISSCIERCWSKHGFGEDRVADDCYVIDVFVQDRNITSSELENEFTTALFEEIVKGKETKLKIRYDPSVPRISLYVVE